jgi:hypothetical protein
VRGAAALAAILIAIAVQTTLAGYIFRGSSTAIDLVLIVVVYVGIKSGRRPERWRALWRD